MVGHTTSKQLPTNENAIQRKFAGGFRYAFLLRLNPEGKAAEYLAYLGGSYNGLAHPDETAATRSTSQTCGACRRATVAFTMPTFKAGLGQQQDSLLHILGRSEEGRRDRARAGPGEVATFVGETWPEDFPTSNALQTKLGSINDSFVTQICDPWLSASNALVFHTIGGDRPQTFELEMGSSCPLKFEATEMVVDVNPDGLVAGEYKPTIRGTVPAALHPTLEIPVMFTVAEPKPEEPLEEPTKPASANP